MEILSKKEIQFLNRNNYPTLLWKDLVDNELLQNIIEYIPENSSWRIFFNKIKDNKIYDSLIENLKIAILNTKKIIYPPPNLVFSAFVLTELKKIKVVICGQDPYPNMNAMGLAFSVPIDSKVFPPSLKNIKKNLAEYVEYEEDEEGEDEEEREEDEEEEDEGDEEGDKEKDYNNKNDSGSLTSWALQGVFLINTALTVESGNSNSHSEIWQEFTDYLFNYITKKRKKIVYVIWGSFANKMLYKKIDTKNNAVITSSHPSPLSATKSFKGYGYGKDADKQFIYPAFVNVDHFNKINRKLKKLGYNDDELINWDLF